MEDSNPRASVSRSGEEKVDELKKSEEKKRDFYTNIAKWVDSVSAE